MNEGIRYYSTEFDQEPDQVRIMAVRQRKAEILAKLAFGARSHMELVSLADKDASLENYDIINTALLELVVAGAINKTYDDVTDQQNVVVGYELAHSD